ncbi:conserved hypothetical protein [Pediculus humanus corporis]|uniref:PDZ domain-containing protein n=1 Tax=Pediculus humanus subsp. corporis TaxID=121224 RepID=E0VAS4_PEDHC|nr:uncharacterized protein Phum_PHUM043720 [Pediculus humanus corporis]EEB10480.1 conserved hypothetical protein [Pediculus humanus corporis]
MVPVVSTTIGLVSPTSSISRMPPDGHEFPQKYTEEPPLEKSPSMTTTVKGSEERQQSESVLADSAVLPPLPASEPPSAPFKYPPIYNGDVEIFTEKKFFVPGVPTELPVQIKSSRNSFWRQDEKSEKSVRDKIAMFSSVPDSAPPNPSNGKLNKYKSSEDVFYCDETDCNRNFPNGKISSSSAYSSSCSPDSSLSSNSSYLGYSSTLPRKKTRNEESKNNLGKKDNVGIQRTTSFSVHGRSQSLLDINPTPYKSRYLSESLQDDGQKPGSLNLLIEQRRKNLSKLRGLVIPEKSTNSVPGLPIVDLPEIRSRDLILSSKVPSAYKEKNLTKQPRATLPEVVVPKVSPTHLWDMQTPLKPPRNVPLVRQNSVCDDPSPLLDNQHQTVDDPGLRSRLLFSPERNQYSRTPSSDMRSSMSISSNSSNPPSETQQMNMCTNEGNLNDANNKRILKPQSVEAINRKNVLASAKYSRGFDVKSEVVENGLNKNNDFNYTNSHNPMKKHSENGLTVVDKDNNTLTKPKIEKVAYITDVVDDGTDVLSDSNQNKKKLEKSESLPATTTDPNKSSTSSLRKASVLNGNRGSINDIRKSFEKVETLPSNPVRLMKSVSVTTGTTNNYNGINGNHFRGSSLDSTASEDGPYGCPTNLFREQFGSITSLASSTSLISPQELQLLLEEANQTLEESGNVGGGLNTNNHDVLVIILHRDTVGGSIGITLAGGADYESKEITVHKVLAGSPADRDGRIQKGDRILSINGKSMKGSPRLEVVLVVSRLKSDILTDCINSDDSNGINNSIRQHSMVRAGRMLKKSTLLESDESSFCQTARGPPVSLTLVKDGAGLGFSLEGGKDCSTGDKPLVIKKIFTGGAAEKCGQLKAGDELLNINGMDVSIMSRIEAWKLMKQLPDGNVTITVRHEVENRP